MPARRLSDQERDRFDAELERVLAALPPQVHEVLEQVPLVVEDYPSSRDRRAVLRDEDEADLCGLYHGVALPDRNADAPYLPPEQIYLYRCGVLDLVHDHCGRFDLDELRRQIRITVLHEIGHHFGLDEDDLEELGYG